LKSDIGFVFPLLIADGRGFEGGETLEILPELSPLPMLPEETVLLVIILLLLLLLLLLGEVEEKLKLFTKAAAAVLLNWKGGVVEKAFFNAAEEYVDVDSICAKSILVARGGVFNVKLRRGDVEDIEDEYVCCEVKKDNGGENAFLYRFTEEGVAEENERELLLLFPGFWTISMGADEAGAMEGN